MHQAKLIKTNILTILLLFTSSQLFTDVKKVMNSVGQSQFYNWDNKTYY